MRALGKKWLGRLDSNQRVRESKSLALPLGDAPMEKDEGIGETPIPSVLSGVGDGTRTHNARNHNPVLCQLNYTHQMGNSSKPCSNTLRNGTPEGTRTPGPLLRRQLLYPAELLAQIGKLEQVTRIELASPAWKAGALTIVLHLRVPSGELVSSIRIP